MIRLPWITSPGIARHISLSGLIAVVVVCVCSIPGYAEDARRPKKLIEVGCDIPDSDQLPKLLDQVEKQPFDGIVVQVVGRKEDGSSITLGYGFCNDQWRREWFQPAVNSLRSCKFQRLTDNFVLFNANPGNVDWFDDAGWANIVEHWRIAAWIARQSGFKGICFDPEAYCFPNAQFEYHAQPGKDAHAFAEYCEKARQRGREVMEAITSEYPDITILSFFLNTYASKAVDRAAPNGSLVSLQYGLLPAMLDGWLDVAPPTVTMVDGCEPSYDHNGRQDYLESANLIRNACQSLVAPENRAKYQAQVQVGFAFYLDAYWNPEGSPWYIDGLGGSRVERLRCNVQDALSIADQYVWIYGEKFRWWPVLPSANAASKDGVQQQSWPGASRDLVEPQSWPEVIPGCDDALRYARDPIGYARAEVARLRALKEPSNLARNGDFASAIAKSGEGQEVAYGDGGPPAGWGTWQDEKSHGILVWDRSKGAAKSAGVRDGCFVQDYRVEPGQRYVVLGKVQVQGKGQGAINVRWMGPNSVWRPDSDDTLLLPEPSGDSASSPWANLIGVVRVPEGASSMVLLLCASRQTCESDVIWLDDIEVYKLP